MSRKRPDQLLVRLGACRLLAEMGQLKTLEAALTRFPVSEAAGSSDPVVQDLLAHLQTALAEGREHEAVHGAGSWVKPDHPVNQKTDRLIAWLKNKKLRPKPQLPYRPPDLYRAPFVAHTVKSGRDLFKSAVSVERDGSFLGQQKHFGRRVSEDGAERYPPAL